MQAIENPLTVAELRTMQERHGCVKAVISVPWDETGDIESLNDLASVMITGSECGLEGLEYRLVGADVESQEVLVEVTASADSFLADNDDEYDGENSSTFYAADAIGRLKLVVRDGAVYGLSDGEKDAYLGEWDEDGWVPSNKLLRSTAPFQGWVEEFQRANKPG